MSGYHPQPTAAMVATARDYLRACIEMERGTDTDWIDALNGEEVITHAMRWWPPGWSDFCRYFASEIGDAEQQASTTRHGGATESAETGKRN
ncbi:hypothetical protein [Nocardia altamirensis]|uniref:hypothetical protein n=1 Tax=Nocardia altamirensis TaxID=472158 RepID=UPI00084092E1|nr:hypothetical protein [Nocardia altamirensis]